MWKKAQVSTSDSSSGGMDASVSNELVLLSGVAPVPQRLLRSASSEHGDVGMKDIRVEFTIDHPYCSTA